MAKKNALQELVDPTPTVPGVDLREVVTDADTEPEAPELKRFSVKLNDGMKFHHPEMEIEAADWEEAVEKYKKLNGILSTVHKFSVSDLPAKKNVKPKLRPDPNPWTPPSDTPAAE